MFALLDHDRNLLGQTRDQFAHFLQLLHLLAAALKTYVGERGATKTVMVQIAVESGDVTGKQIQVLTLFFQEVLKKGLAFEKYPGDLGNGERGTTGKGSVGNFPAMTEESRRAPNPFFSNNPVSIS